MKLAQGVTNSSFLPALDKGFYYMAADQVIAAEELARIMTVSQQLFTPESWELINSKLEPGEREELLRLVAHRIPHLHYDRIFQLMAQCHGRKNSRELYDSFMNGIDPQKITVRQFLSDLECWI